MTPKQEEALRDYLQEVIVPLIEEVLVKKLGQAMTFAKKELAEQPARTLKELHQLSREVSAQQALDKKAENARELGLDYEPEQEPVAWRNAAIRLGEELSSVGPDGYYNMTAEQWLDWAMDQHPQGKNSLITPPAAQRQHLTDGSLCWCEPETIYTDPETGASVIVHKEPQ